MNRSSSIFEPLSLFLRPIKQEIPASNKITLEPFKGKRDNPGFYELEIEINEYLYLVLFEAVPIAYSMDDCDCEIKMIEICRCHIKQDAYIAMSSIDRKLYETIEEKCYNHIMDEEDLFFWHK